MSATPDLFSLLRVLHFQLRSEKLPDRVENARDALQVLREAAAGVKALYAGWTRIAHACRG